MSQGRQLFTGNVSNHAKGIGGDEDIDTIHFVLQRGFPSNHVVAGNDAFFFPCFCFYMDCFVFLFCNAGTMEHVGEQKMPKILFLFFFC